MLFFLDDIIVHTKHNFWGRALQRLLFNNLNFSPHTDVIINFWFWYLRSKMEINLWLNYHNLLHSRKWFHIWLWGSGWGVVVCKKKSPPSVMRRRGATSTRRRPELVSLLMRALFSTLALTSLEQAGTLTAAVAATSNHTPDWADWDA